MERRHIRRRPRRVGLERLCRFAQAGETHLHQRDALAAGLRGVIGQPLNQRDAQPQPLLRRGLAATNAPVRDTDHDLIIRRLALAQNITMTTWIRMANHVRTRLRHGKLNIPRARRRRIQAGKEPCHHPSRHRYRARQRPLTKLLPGEDWIVDAEPATDPTHADHPHYDGSTGVRPRLWGRDAQRGIGHASIRGLPLPATPQTAGCSAFSSAAGIARGNGGVMRRLVRIGTSVVLSPGRP
jgi:hypothetical protein